MYIFYSIYRVGLLTRIYIYIHTIIERKQEGTCWYVLEEVSSNKGEFHSMEPSADGKMKFSHLKNESYILIHEMNSYMTEQE